MRQIEKDLGGINLEKINSAAYLIKLRNELQSKNAFMSRRNQTEVIFFLVSKHILIMLGKRQENNSISVLADCSSSHASVFFWPTL
jgi:hypothetical protein